MKKLCKLFPILLVLCLLLAVGAGLSGLMMSYYIGASTGASITLVLALCFALTFCFRKRVS